MALVDHTRIRRDGMAAIAAAVVLIALAVANSVPPWAVARPTVSPAGSSTASRAAVSADSEIMASHKGKRDLGIRGHGFIPDDDGFTTIDAPGPSVLTLPFGISNHGQIVGGYFDTTGTLRGFLRDKKDFTSIEVPGAQLTPAYKINDHGQIVGIYSTDGIVRYGYLLDRQGLTTIDVPGAAGMFHGYLRDTNANFTTIDLPGARGTSITGINDRGQMIGVYGNASGTTHGFLLDQGVVTTIDVPGAVFTVPFGLNNRGQVVGVYDDGMRSRGFLLENGNVTTPAVPPGAFGTSFPLDIDDRGWIVGVYQ